METLVGLVIGLALGFVVLLALAYVLHWLWNTTMPEVMGVKEITVVQAIKLMFIASILFGGHRVITVETPPTAQTPAEASAP